MMQKAILATDLVLFFSNKENFSKIVESGNFSWDVTEHRSVDGKNQLLVLLLTVYHAQRACFLPDDDHL